ncbi:Fungal-specific transcription factor protein [Penicillium herquei]|nr:Fungal-specific transcription factor protein [Penicillium herquei]
MSDRRGSLQPPDENPVTASRRDRDLPTPSKRRDKPQLSCNACRGRKNLGARALTQDTGFDATDYSLAVTVPVEEMGPPHGGHVQDRINRLENLVLGLMQQSTSNPYESPSEDVLITKSLLTPQSNGLSRSSVPSCSGGDQRARVARAPDEMPSPSPSPSDQGSIHTKRSGVSYVSSAHWSAVLESIDELRDHLEQEDNGHMVSSYTPQPQTSFPSPHLFYAGCHLNVTPASILNCVPPRPVADRLIACYFNFLDMAPGVPHTEKFLREYDDFWKCPQAAPIIWLGLLFGMMCLATQFQQSLLTPDNTISTGGYYPGSIQQQESNTDISVFRTNMIHCLLLGHYTKGGPYVIETLILYFMVEVFGKKDTEAGTRILVGNIVHIAMHMGYHRDAKHFPNISPFAGEMRRRVWALIMQLDFSLSSQVGLPRIIKENQTDVAEPRNLADSDLNESITELPPSRPESEVTPTLYTLAKLRLISVGAKVADVATEPQPHSYTHVLQLDKEIDETRKGLPVSMKWTSLASSLSVPPQVVIQRIWLEVCVQRLKIVLHKQFMVASRLQQQYTSTYSASACLLAATKIIELQHLIDEETQVNGRLYQSRWRVTATFIHDFLLATSTLCIYLQVHKLEQARDQTSSGVKESLPDMEKLKRLLRKTQVIWLRESAASSEARKAASALNYVLGDPGVYSDSSLLFEQMGSSFQEISPVMLGLEPPGLSLELSSNWLSWQEFVQPMDDVGSE